MRNISKIKPNDYSYNSTSYSFIENGTSSTREVDELESSYIVSFADLTIKSRFTGENIAIVASVDMSPSGEWYGDGFHGIIE